MAKKIISIVTPFLNEEDNIRPFYDAVVDIASSSEYSFEIVYVDDGSQDSSAEKVGKLPQAPLQIQLVSLSRNFGKEAAVSAGLSQVKGDAAIVIDVDLQHPIDKIPEFIEKWEKGADVVVGVRKHDGHHSFVKNITSRLFYKLINMVSETEIIPRATDYRLLSREVIDQFNQLTEHNRMTRGMIDWLGYDRAIVEFDANERKYGSVRYSYRKLTKLAINTFVSYSFFPLRLAGYLGGFIAFASGVLGFFVIIENFLLNDPLSLKVTGTAMLTLVLLFLVGIVLVCLGLFGLYIASIYDEAQNRPVYVIRKNKKPL